MRIKYILVCCIFIFTFLFYSFQYTDLSNPLLRSFDNFWLSFADKVMIGRYKFVSLKIKVKLLEWALGLSFSLSGTDKMK